MAFTPPGTAVAGEVLTAAFWNTNVRDNISSLAATRTANESEWTDFSPTVTQGVSVTFTKNRARFLTIGKTIHYNVSLVITSSGTASTGILIGGLVAPKNTTGWSTVGSAVIVVGATRHSATFSFFNGTNPFFQVGSSNDILGVSPSVQLVNTSVISFEAVYEIA